MDTTSHWSYWFNFYFRNNSNYFWSLYIWLRARINIWGQVTSKVSTELKKIAKFYNKYQIINFSDQNELKSKKKALTKQMEELVNVVLPALAKIGETNSEMPVGMLLVSLVSDKLVSEEKFIEVQKNLKEMKKLGDMLGFDKRLVGILNALVP